MSVEYWQAWERCARCHQRRYGTDLYSRRGRPSTEGYCLLYWHELDGRRDIGGLATVLAVLAIIVVVVFIVDPGALADHRCVTQPGLFA